MIDYRFFMKMRGMVASMLFFLISCDEKVKPENEARIDEEKPERVTGTIEARDRDLDMALPSPKIEGIEEISVNLEITHDGKLYGSSGEERSLLADKVGRDKLGQTKEWLAGFKAQDQTLAVTIKFDENQLQQSVIDLLNLFAELNITKVTFSD